MPIESEELAALQRLMLMFVPESEWPAVMAEALALMDCARPMADQQRADASQPHSAGASAS